MKRLERKLLQHCLLIGAALTALIVLADAAGLLRPLENWLYDRRARWCQFFAPPPTRSLIHLDIDDHAIEVIGRWPWSRSTWALLLDEITLAGPKAVELDVLLSEPESPADDAALADAIARAANVILPVQLDLRRPDAPLYAAMFDALRRDPELDEAALAERVRARGLVRSEGALEELFIRARREAVFARVAEELARGPAVTPPPPPPPSMTTPASPTPPPPLPPTAPTATGAPHATITATAPTPNPSTPNPLIPDPSTPNPLSTANSSTTNPSTTSAATVTARSLNAMLRERILTQKRELSSPLSRLIDQQYERVLAHREVSRFAVPRPPGGPPVTTAVIKLPPLRVLAESSAGAAFVDYPQFDDPVVRAVPMFFECDGRLFPQMGLALACRMLDVDPAAVQIEPDTIVLPRPMQAGGSIRIPVAPSRASSEGVRLERLADIPWFGTRDWRLMYDHPRHAAVAQHLSLLAVWDAHLTNEKIRRNNTNVDEAIHGLLSVLDPAKFEAYQKSPPGRDEIAARAAVARATLADDRTRSTLALYESMTPAELTADPDGSRFKAAHGALHNWLGETPGLAEQLKQQRAALAAALKDKAALIGWIATAAVADFVPTSLHDKCPGVVVHGAVYNGIVTGEMWRRLPWAATAIVTLVLGVATAGLTGYLAPVPAFLSALALFAGYLVINGIAMFDFGNRIIGAAGPLVAVGTAWAGCTLTRVVAERAERERIRRRFSNYVDPKLVNYVLENPDATFDGERREMTVVFTDLVGFTSLSERMGEKVVPLLNDLLEELVPVIRDVHQGYINKFLGDGIMFFFNAPYLSATHAGDAVATVLAMQETLARFNERLARQGLPPLGMRAGISTAEMIVGNAGGAGANDYTVLGDAVNLGARLEAANKLTGTRTLMTARTAELLDGTVICRPVGRLKVVGKDEAVMVYEPLTTAVAATDLDRDLAALTTQMVDAFVTARFADTLLILDQMDALTAGPGKLTTLYRRMSEHYLNEPPDGTFDGRVVLTEK